LRELVVERAVGFARLWYIKDLAFVRTGYYGDQFNRHDEETERSAAAGNRIGDVVDSLMARLADKVR
jgi:hypothetical protein